MPRIAIAGKGGTGKTTIAGTLARTIARRGLEVWAIDADSSPNLALTLGISRARAADLTPLPRTLLQELVEEHGQRRMALAMAPSDIVKEYGVRGDDKVMLLLMGRVDHAGAGCMCRAHAQVRHLLGGMLEANAPVTIVDMEAGLEHLSRGTARNVDMLCVTLEPYYKALETARRSAELARELGISSIVAVANKIRDEHEAAAVREYARAHGLTIAGEIPYDDAVRKGDMLGVPPIEHRDSAAVRAIEWLAAALVP